jgi:hypothetical protein
VNARKLLFLSSESAYIATPIKKEKMIFLWDDCILSGLFGTDTECVAANNTAIEEKIASAIFW